MEQDENTSNVPMSEHAQFRQYSFLQGRWLAPDPYMGSYDLSNPQSMNRYAYVLNNPLSFIDPTGLDYGFDCGDDCVGVEGTTDDPVPSTALPAQRQCLSGHPTSAPYVTRIKWRGVLLNLEISTLWLPESRPLQARGWQR